MTKNNYDTPQTKYTSLSEIRERKQALLNNIRNDDSQMKALWDQLFGTSPSSLTTNLPSKRFSGFLSTGAGVFDGIVLGWKLYRKFKRRASDGNSVTTTTSAPATSTAPSANNASAAPTANTVDNTTAPSAPAPSTGTASNAGAGTTAKPSTENTTAQGANANVSGEEKSTTPASNNEHPSPASTSNAGTTTNNAATDPNSQVIKPNEQHPTAENTEQANEQVQTDKKPKATYNLKIRYTIGGAANKQLVQPYELTIDQEDFDNLGKDGKYEYIELPKAAGYRPSVYHSGDYQYYIKNSEDKFVIDDGTDADAKRYLRLSKKLITDYAVKKRQAVESNNSAQSSQNPSSTQSGSDDGIQYYGELNINYAPKTAKYYVRHLVQDLDHKDEFHDLH